MAKIPKHALILFDVDGCTSIVETSKLKSRRVLQPSLRCSFVHRRTEYKVEVLQLSDSKQELNAYENEWARSERAMALDREKSMRGDSENGYLMVWPEEDVEEVVPPSPTATRRPGQNNHRTEPSIRGEAVVPVTEEIVGLNNRTITVHYQGSSEESRHTVAPRRNPLFLDDLSQDERDCVLARVEDFHHTRRSIATQTEDDLVFKDKEELLASYDPKGRSLSDLFSKLQGQGNTISKIVLQNQKTTECLQEILSVVKGLRDDRDVSRLIHLGLLNDLNSSSVTDTEPLIATSYDKDNDLETSKENDDLETSSMKDSGTINKDDNQGKGNNNDKPGASNKDDDNPITTSNKIGHETLDNETIDIDEAALFFPNAVRALNANKTNDIKANQENHQPAEQKKMLTMRTSPSPATSLSQSLICSKGPIVEIYSYQDMKTVDPTAEIRIAPHLQKQFQGCTNWAGGFAWQIAQRVYHPNELIGRNYYGKFHKPSLSPRRRHAIEHAIIDNVGDDIFSLRKAVEGINTGIRNKTNKGKMKSARPPMAPHPTSQDGNSVN